MAHDPDSPMNRNEAIMIRAFAPLHKRAFGLAVGSASGLLVFLMTAVYLITDPEPAFDLGLLRQYFSGYSVSWPGAVVGALWGGFVGFVAGWFLAFVRNFVVAGILLWIRSRTELAATTDFLDHI